MASPSTLLETLPTELLVNTIRRLPTVNDIRRLAKTNSDANALVQAHEHIVARPIIEKQLARINESIRAATRLV